jgi:hypothetical protein
MKREELIERLKQVAIVDTDKIIIKELDYSNNPLSPVEIAYRVHFTSLGKRRKVTYFGENIGFQG